VRETDVYALMLARSDGTLGPQFHHSELACDSPGRARFSPNVPPAGQRPACGVITSIPASSIIGGNTGIEPFTRGLVAAVGRQIVDRTGLTGTFDVVLTYSMESMHLPVLPAGVEAPAAPTGLPSVFTALVEQTGLKLEPARAPLDYHVIVRAETPTAN